MRFRIYVLRLSVYALCLMAIFPTRAQETNRSILPIDLSTALRLANAQNHDVQIAREKLKEAKANHASAVSQFFPWIAPGISYRRHDNLIQAVDGQLINVHKQSWAPGVTLAAQVDIG